MKTIFNFLLVCLTLLNLTSCHSQVFNFPKSEIGNFAKAWFEAVNKSEPSTIKDYPIEEWNDFFESIVDHVENTGGLKPQLISYITEDEISIYSKEGVKKWVTVNLGYSREKGITLMGIRKSYEPVVNDKIEGLNEDQFSDVMQALEKEFKRNYVRPDMGRQLGEFILDEMSDKYLGITQGDLLAKKLTKDLRKYARDKHLQVIPPTLVKEVDARFYSEDIEIADQDEIPIKSRILEGNIGLITLDRFSDSDVVRQKTREIFEEMLQTNNLIIDLTHSGGGDGKAVEQFLSYLGIGKREGLVNDNPVYILTSKKSISAAEALAYHVKQSGRGKLVGERTAGAGYLVDVFKLPHGFYLVNSIKTNFSNNEGWQGKGVTPDFLSRSSEALQKTLQMIKVKN